MPGVLGLHANAEMGYFTKASKDLWNNLLKIQPQTGNIIDRQFRFLNINLMLLF